VEGIAQLLQLAVQFSELLVVARGGGARWGEKERGVREREGRGKIFSPFFSPFLSLSKTNQKNNVDWLMMGPRCCLRLPLL